MSASESARQVGVKVYSTDWYLAHGMDYEEAADRLVDQGFTFVIAQNRYLPMADSAVKSEVTPEQAERYRDYDDRAFVRAVQSRGLRYFAACNMFFDTATLKEHPDALPTDAQGLPAELIDWYLGVSPTHEGYLQAKLDQIAEATRELQPDGLFLGFTRFPGFWELWLPDNHRSDFPEYCFSDRSIAAFEAHSGVRVPDGDTQTRATWIRREAYDAFVTWKCDVVRDVVARARSVVKAERPDAAIMLNTLPFRRDDFERAGVEVFAQDWRKLADVVDIFELMTYHQILARDTSWIRSVVEDFKAVVPNEAYCTLQADPLYLEGMHAARHRSSTLDAAEFERAVAEVGDAPADGVVVFTWSDFLRQAASGDMRRIDALRTYGGR